MFDDSSGGSMNGHKVINCSFENVQSNMDMPPGIGIYTAGTHPKYNITDCFFRNLSSTDGNVRGGAINCDMRIRNNDGYFNISGNTFINVKTNISVVTLSGNFLSLTFIYNSFYNVSSPKEGGVLFIYFIIIFLGSFLQLYNNKPNSYI
jgi:hypothetical protein